MCESWHIERLRRAVLREQHSCRDNNGQPIVSLKLARTALTDFGLKEIAGLKIDSLHEFYLSETEVTEIGLRELAAFPNLRILTLANTKVNDSGMNHLAK